MNDYTMEADNIKQGAGSKMHLHAGGTWEQKSDGSMRIDGGNKMDIEANVVKLS